jgi:hypothetical protein
MCVALIVGDIRSVEKEKMMIELHGWKKCNELKYPWLFGEIRWISWAIGGAWRSCLWLVDGVVGNQE